MTVIHNPSATHAVIPGWHWSWRPAAPVPSQDERKRTVLSSDHLWFCYSSETPDFRSILQTHCWEINMWIMRFIQCLLLLNKMSSLISKTVVLCVLLFLDPANIKTSSSKCLDWGSISGRIETTICEFISQPVWLWHSDQENAYSTAYIITHL